MNGITGPSMSDTITGGKTLELSEYDKVRKPHKIKEDGTTITIGARTLTTEICCPICLDLFTATMGTKECLHRFCSECINTALLRNNKECPTCRKKIVSKRSLRSDTNMDGLLSKIWPERKLYDEMQSEANNYYQTNVASLQKSIEAGIKAQAQNRRQRIQGSYDYEKRKRKRRLPDGEQEDTMPNSPSDITPPINGDSQDATPLNDDGSSTFDSDASDSSSELSSTITDSSDLDSMSSDDETNTVLNGPTTSHNSAPPSLENMALASPADESTSDAVEKLSYSAKLLKYQEIEIELIPSISLRQKPDVPLPLKKSRFIKSHRNTTMEHLSEYLLQECRADLAEQEAKGQQVTTAIPTPTFFFAFDTDTRLYTVPLTEILRQVHESSPPTSDHLKLFFDTDSHNEARLEQYVLSVPIPMEFEEELSDD